jgi:hypothetical protein
MDAVETEAGVQGLALVMTGEHRARTGQLAIGGESVMDMGLRKGNGTPGRQESFATPPPVFPNGTPSYLASGECLVTCRV